MFCTSGAYFILKLDEHSWVERQSTLAITWQTCPSDQDSRIECGILISINYNTVPVCNKCTWRALLGRPRPARGHGESRLPNGAGCRALLFSTWSHSSCTILCTEQSKYRVQSTAVLGVRSMGSESHKSGEIIITWSYTFYVFLMMTLWGVYFIDSEFWYTKSFFMMKDDDTVFLIK